MKISVIYSTDDNYAMHAGISIISLFSNNKEFEEIDVYIIDNNISVDNKKKLKDISLKFNRRLIFIPFDKFCIGLNNDDDFYSAAYGRLFLARLNNLDKVLYLDCDTVINESLNKLWSIDINKYFVAGVQDNPAKYAVDIIGMDDNDRYLNSGVLLINLKKFREFNVEEKMLKFIEDYLGKVPHHDQGVINGVCKGKILIIDPKYNSMPQFWQFNTKQIKKLYNIKNYYNQRQVDEAVNNPVIIHYINKFYGRPWFEKCDHPMKELYLNYLIESPWTLRLEKVNIDYKVAIRKFIYKYFPFEFYCKIEHLLDLKRKRYINKKYKIIQNNN